MQCDRGLILRQHAYNLPEPGVLSEASQTMPGSLQLRRRLCRRHAPYQAIQCIQLSPTALQHAHEHLLGRSVEPLAVDRSIEGLEGLGQQWQLQCEVLEGSIVS